MCVFNFNLKFAPEIIRRLVDSYIKHDQDLEPLKQALQNCVAVIDNTLPFEVEIGVDEGNIPVNTWTSAFDGYNYFNLKRTTHSNTQLFVSFNIKFAPELIRRFTESYCATGHSLSVIRGVILGNCMHMLHAKLNGVVQQ